MYRKCLIVFKRVLIILIMILSIASCSSGESHWNGSFKELPSTAQDCAINWVDNVYLIKELESMLAGFKSQPTAFMVLKSGQSGWPSYEFLGFFEFNGIYKTVFIEPTLDKPIEMPTSDKVIEQLISVFSNTHQMSNIILENKYQKLSHTPCNFAYVKSSHGEWKAAIVGIMDNKEIIPPLRQIFEIKESSTPSSYTKSHTDTGREIPSERETQKLAGTIKDDLFFELSVFNLENSEE